MVKLKNIKNRIVMTVLAIPMLASAISAPVHAEIPTTDGATVTITQKWSGNSGGNTDVTYDLTPLGEVTDSGYSTNTKKALENESISYSVKYENGYGFEDRFTLSGDTKLSICFDRVTPGLYLFDLAPANINDGNGYKYDHTKYRIRLYVSNGGSRFFTVQNLSLDDDGDSGKVGEIVYTHQYTKNSSGSDSKHKDSDSSDPGSGKPSNSNASSKTDNAASAGTTGTGTPDPDSKTQKIKEEGNKSGGGTGKRMVYATGDSSNIVLYEVVAGTALSVLGIWLATRRRKN